MAWLANCPGVSISWSRHSEKSGLGFIESVHKNDWKFQQLSRSTTCSTSSEPNDYGSAQTERERERGGGERERE